MSWSFLNLTKIIFRHLQLTIPNYEELNKLLASITIAQGGVLPNIQAVLLPKKTEKATKLNYLSDVLVVFKFDQKNICMFVRIINPLGFTYSEVPKSRKQIKSLSIVALKS